MSFATTPRPGGALRAALVLLFLCLAAGPSTAQVRGISYTLSPAADHVFFDRNAGLEDAFLFGGELGFGFGQHVELQARYLFNNDLKTRYDRLTGLEEAARTRLEPLAGRRLGFQRYGGQLKLNLLQGAAVPFVTVGTGLVRFAPDSLNDSRTIYLSAGAGLQLTLADRYAFSLGAENLTYRYNLGASFFDDADLIAAGLAPESFNQTQVNNWVARAALSVYVGGRNPGAETALDEAFRQQLTGGLRGLSLRIEPFSGQLSFSEALDFRKDQRMSGVFAGLNFGPYVGLRGFYWRGLEDGGFLFDFDRLQAYGGEMRFRFADTASLTPYLAFGGGYLDVLSGYEGRNGAVPEDKPFLTGGAGVLLPLGESLLISGGVRALMASNEGVDNVSDPGDVHTNWMYTLGVTFAFGGQGNAADEVVRARMAGAEAAATSREARLQAELQRTQARLDSLAAVLARVEGGETAARLQPPAVADTAQTLQGAAEGPMPTTQVDARGARTMTLPVPAEGELYIRFGPPGGVTIESVTGDGALVVDSARVRAAVPSQGAAALTAEQIEEIVRRTLQEQLAAVRTSAAGEAASLEDLERRLQERMDRELLRLQGTAAEPTTVVVPEREARPVEVNVTPASGAFDPQRALPFVSVMFGEPMLVGFGVRGDVLRLFGPLRLHPEFVLGLGQDNYAYHLNLDAIYTVPFFEETFEGFAPYVGLGGGLLGFNEATGDVPGVQFTLNLRLGSTFNYRNGRFFAEYATFDFFDFNRFALGYRIPL